MAIVGFCAASAYGWFNGDPAKLLIGWDSDLNGCGYNETTKDYPFLYWPEPPSLDLKADLEGNIAFRLVFNDSAQMTLEGGSCTFDGRVGREEVRVHWEAHLKEDRAYVEALAAFESNQVRRTGERASIMARYEADIAAAAESKDKDKLEAKARDVRAEAEDAIRR